jgi:hypothetical protein
MLDTDRTYKGAIIHYRYHRDDTTVDYRRGYVSFGVYDEFSGLDSFGVEDDKVFYYTDLLELTDILMDKNNDREFYVLRCRPVEMSEFPALVYGDRR